MNRCQKAPQELTTSSNLTDQGWVAARTREMRGTPWTVDVAVREATPNACGVGVARLQGHSRAPRLTTDWRANVGTIPVVPSTAGSLPAVGKVRCRLMLSGWDGGSVVVAGVTTCHGGRESRPQGEGIQRVRGIYPSCGGRW